jgi:hypothetical protein
MQVLGLRKNMKWFLFALDINRSRLALTYKDHDGIQYIYASVASELMELAAAFVNCTWR